MGLHCTTGFSKFNFSMFDYLQTRIVRDHPIHESPNFAPHLFFSPSEAQPKNALINPLPPKKQKWSTHGKAKWLAVALLSCGTYNRIKFCKILQSILQFCNPFYNFAIHFTILQSILQFCNPFYNFEIHFTILQSILQFWNPFYNFAILKLRTTTKQMLLAGSRCGSAVKWRNEKLNKIKRSRVRSQARATFFQKSKGFLLLLALAPWSTQGVFTRTMIFFLSRNVVRQR
jgi:hypothetical protein